MLIIMENVANIELTCLICLNIVRMARSWLISVSSEATHNAAKTTTKYTTPQLPRERDEVRRTKKKIFTSNDIRIELCFILDHPFGVRTIARRQNTTGNRLTTWRCRLREFASQAPNFTQKSARPPAPDPRLAAADTAIITSMRKQVIAPNPVAF